MSSKFVHHRVVTPFWFSVPNVMAMFRWGSPHGANNADKVGKNCDSRRICGYRIDEWWSANNNCDDPPCSLPHRPSRINESCLSQPAWMATTKRREQNLITRTCKSEAEVTNNRRLRSTYCTIEANYRLQTRSIARPVCDSRATCI